MSKQKHGNVTNVKTKTRQRDEMPKRQNAKTAK